MPLFSLRVCLRIPHGIFLYYIQILMRYIQDKTIIFSVLCDAWSVFALRNFLHSAAFNADFTSRQVLVTSKRLIFRTRSNVSIHTPVREWKGAFTTRQKVVRKENLSSPMEESVPFICENAAICRLYLEKNRWEK